MRKIILIITSIIFLYSCDTTFKAEKVATENYNNGFIYESYLVTNTSDIPEKRYPILLSFIENRLNEINKTNSNLSKFGIAFYDNVSCTRRFYKNYKNLKGVESIVDRCEEYYCGSFQYKKSKEKPNQWYLIFPKNMRDTIYCDKK